MSAPAQNPRTVTTRISGYNNAVVDFDKPPTVGGQPLQPPAATIPTLAATSPTLLTPAGVTFSVVQYNVDGNQFATLRFKAQCTTTTNTNNTYANFQISLPNRTTQFTDGNGIVVTATGYDANGAYITQLFGQSVASSTSAIINFMPNVPVAQSLDLTLTYKIN